MLFHLGTPGEELAHLLGSSGMRRIRFRGRENVWTRTLIHACAFNLSCPSEDGAGGSYPQALGKPSSALSSAEYGLYRVFFGSNYQKPLQDEKQEGKP